MFPCSKGQFIRAYLDTIWMTLPCCSIGGVLIIENARTLWRFPAKTCRQQPFVQKILLHLTKHNGLKFFLNGKSYHLYDILVHSEWPKVHFYIRPKPKAEYWKLKFKTNWEFFALCILIYVGRYGNFSNCLGEFQVQCRVNRHVHVLLHGV